MLFEKNGRNGSMTLRASYVEAERPHQAERSRVAVSSSMSAATPSAGPPLIHTALAVLTFPMELEVEGADGTMPTEKKRRHLS